MNTEEIAIPNSLTNVLQNIRRAEGEQSEDFFADTLDGQLVIIEQASLTTMRLNDLLGRLAACTLQLRTALSRLGLAGVPLVIVKVSSLTMRTVESVQEFMGDHARDIQWALVTDRTSFVSAPALQVVSKALPPRRNSPRLSSQKKSVQAFSDLNQWMLKVLLLANVEGKFWGGPRAVIRTTRELAELAEVSVPHAHRFVQTFESLDHLRFNYHGLVIVRL